MIFFPRLVPRRDNYVRNSGFENLNPPQPMKPSFMFRNGLCLSCLFIQFSQEKLRAANITWIGGNVDWVDNGSNANWSPADEPDADDVAIFNTANSVSLGSSNSILGLTLSGGIDLDTNSHDLIVDGLVQLSGASTSLTIDGSASLLTADSVTVNSAGSLIMDQGALGIIEETGSGVLDINSGGTLSGRGTISLSDGLTGVTTSIFNDGTISASAVGLILIGNPPAGTLTFNTADVDARIDLDGTSGSGVINVFRNQTLDINVTLFDGFSSDINLSHNAVLDIAAPWSMDGASTMDVVSGFVAGSPPFIPQIPASTSFVRGGAFTQTGGTISNIDADGTLQFDAPFTMTAGDLVNNGTVVFNANSTIGAGANFTMATGTSSITVNDGVEVNVDQPNFNPDGNSLVTNLLTLGSGGILDFDLGAGGDTGIGSTILLNGGELDVTSTTGAWSLLRSVTTGASTGISLINGNPVSIPAAVTVGSASTLEVNATSTWTGSASVSGLLQLDGALTNLAGGTFSGSGELRTGSSSVVSANTIINTNTFDWDGLGTGTLHTINDGATLTINSAVFDNDGDMDDPISLGGNSAAIVVNGVSEWTATNTITTNPGALGTALINGSARLILEGVSSNLQVKGNTNINAPVTFGTSSTTSVDAARTLRSFGETIFDGGSVSGAGSYVPSGLIPVYSSSSINIATLDMDSANWVIYPGATLSVNVTDYDNFATNAFDSLITVYGGRISVFTADAEFVMNGVLNMQLDLANPTAEWTGEPLDIGDDDSSNLTRFNVSQFGQASIFSQIDFNSDARVTISAGATLNLVGLANFDTVNGADNATFTGGALPGAGTFSFTGAVNFNEAVTFDMSGGSIDMDGSDAIGDLIAVNAPVVMNLASLQTFGKVNGVGTNVLNIDGAAGSGFLNVNLDNPASEWTLNGPGVLNLISNATASTLLAGSAANLNGTVNVTGDVRSAARLDIGGTVNILSVGEPLRLNGGDFANPNTLVGGTINGPGPLGADTGTALTGFGTIATNVDFDGSSDLFADNGTLNLTGGIVDVRNVGTRDTDGILNVINPWNSSVVNAISLSGGEVTGATITLDNAFGITGIGLVSARVINNTRIITAGSGTLVVETAANNNDWDGSGNTGNLTGNFGTLELRDNANFTFAGEIIAQNGGTVFANGFALNPNAVSTITLSNGRFRSTASTSFGGTITVGPGGSSSLEILSPNLLDLLDSSSVNLLGDLRLVTADGRIRAGTTFTGAGSLVIPTGSTVSPDDGADIDVLIDNFGTFRVSGVSVGRIDAQDYQQNAGGTVEVGMVGTGLTQFDRIVINGAAQLAGMLDLRLPGAFVPALGQTFNIISATSGVSGSFASVIQPAGMPAGLAFQVNYLPTLVQIEVVNASGYDAWINSFPELVNAADRLKPANPDGDSLNNLGEFALDGHPADGSNSGKIFGKIALVGGIPAMTLTLAVRTGALPAAGDPPGGELVLDQAADSLTYAVQATDELIDFTLDVTEVLGADAAAIQAGLPAVNVGWNYRTFRSPGPVAGDPAEFMRVFIHD